MSLHEEIVQLAGALSGAPASRLEQICAAVIQNLQTMLRKGVTVEQCRQSFVYAAALMAVSIVKTVDMQEISGFDAGTLKLSFADRSNQLAQMAGQLLAPWCGTDDFAFCGVEG